MTYSACAAFPTKEVIRQTIPSSPPPPRLVHFEKKNTFVFSIRRPYKPDIEIPHLHMSISIVAMPMMWSRTDYDSIGERERKKIKWNAKWQRRPTPGRPETWAKRRNVNNRRQEPHSGRTKNRTTRSIWRRPGDKSRGKKRTKERERDRETEKERNGEKIEDEGGNATRENQRWPCSTLRCYE